MGHILQKNEISRAGAVLADAFQFDPLWNKILEGESDFKQKFQACFETPLRYCHKFGEVFASSNRLEGVAGWVPHTAPDLGFLTLIRSGAIFSAMRMGARTGKKMETVFDPILKDRHGYMEDRPYLYLLVVGVATGFQGRGFGGLIIQELIKKSEKLGNHLYLETETQENVEFYKKHGFNVIQEITLPIVHLPIWEMVREPDK